MEWCRYAAAPHDVTMFEGRLFKTSVLMLAANYRLLHLQIAAVNMLHLQQRWRTCQNSHGSVREKQHIDF